MTAGRTERVTLARIVVGDLVRLVPDRGELGGRRIWSYIPTIAECRKGLGAYVEVVGVERDPGRSGTTTLLLADGTKTFGGPSTRVNRKRPPAVELEGDR